jgi:predicted aspartyl protease
MRNAFLVTALALAALAAGCASSEAETEPKTTRPGTTSAPAAASEQREVALRVESGSWGVFAFADVFIDGEGPFAFTVDTGASSSVVDWDLVRRLKIKTLGKPVTITAIACRGQAGRIKLSDWQLGDVVLPAKKIQTIDMPADGIDGLLGSDVLSTFGSITVDYQGERLLLASAS